MLNEPNKENNTEDLKNGIEKTNVIGMLMNKNHFRGKGNKYI